MYLTRLLAPAIPALVAVALFTGCGGTTDESSSDSTSKYSNSYEGLQLYAANMPASDYDLKPISNSRFNGLSQADRYLVADKLLASLYFGMPAEELDALIASGSFISTIQRMITSETNDLGTVEERLNDNDGDGAEFRFDSWPDGTAEVARILARFYAMEALDKNYIDNWTAYVLTSTIMFSPAYELASSHAPNIDRVYGRLVRSLRDEETTGHSTMIHMMSDDNWRRFRSPEDNGREMLEIYLLDFEDSHVPIAGQALKSWSLDRDNDTLVIGLDDNTEPLRLFGTTITNGYDFYRELVKSGDFTPGVTSRLVDVYFPTFTVAQKDRIVSQIVSSHPKTWEDILLQIVFSEAYLFDSDKPKSAEETVFSLMKKMHFENRRGFFSYFARALGEMNQAAMKYKLGKYTEVPLDTQSFSTYHKYVRESLMLRYKTDWSAGWVDTDLLSDTVFEGISPYEHGQILEALIDHLFLTVIGREASDEEIAIFTGFMLQEDGSYAYPFRIFRDDGSFNDRRYAALVILDYLSRLTQNYRFVKVDQ